jgi:integrase
MNPLLVSESFTKAWTRAVAPTLLLAAGVHPRVVMETLGHSQIAPTMNTYSHVVPALQRDAADRLAAMLG